MMKLYWFPRTRSSRVVWMLEETGVEYERVFIDVNDPAAKQHPGFAAASPFRKVPALEDGEVRMADCAAICMYLADRYPIRELAPAVDDPRRGAYLFWMVFAPGALEPATHELISGTEPNPAGNGWGNFAATITTLEQGLETGPWLLGDQFTAADVMIGGSVLIMEALGVLPGSPRLQGYAELCRERPCCRAAEALEFASRNHGGGLMPRSQLRRGGPRRGT